MKRNIPIVAVASAVCMLSSWAVAQNAPNAKSSEMNAAGGNTPSVQSRDRMNDATTADDARHKTVAESADAVQRQRGLEDPTLSSSERNIHAADKNQKLADKDADNSARNVRDRDDQTLTPLDQGNSQADVDTTAQIRKNIIAGENMSVNARNVKIITQDGRVTLRGPVNSEDEKRMIGDIAVRILKTDNVDNQLEVTEVRVPTVSRND